MENKKGFYLKSASISSILLISSKCIGFLGTCYIANNTSKEFFGNYNFILAIFFSLSIFSLDFNNVIIRALSNNYDGTFKKHAVLSFKFCFLGIGTLALLSLYYFRKESIDLAMAFMISALAFPGVFIFRRWILIYHAKEKFIRGDVLNFITIIIEWFAIFIVIYLFPNNMSLLVCAFFFSSMTLHFLYFQKSLKLLRNNEEEKFWKKSGFTLAINALFDTSYKYVDRILLILFIGPQALAIYIMATAWGDSLKSIASSAMKVTWPKLFKMNDKDLLLIIKDKIMASLLIVITVFIFSWISIPFLIDLMLGEEYSLSKRYAQFYLFVFPLHLYLSIVNNFLLKYKQEKYILLSRIIGSVGNILIYIIFIPTLGIFGGVLGSIAFYFLQLLFSSYAIIKIKRRNILT